MRGSGLCYNRFLGPHLCGVRAVESEGVRLCYTRFLGSSPPVLGVRGQGLCYTRFLGPHQLCGR